MTEYIVISLLTQDDFEAVCKLDEGLREFDFEKDLKGMYFIFNFPENGQYAIVTKEALDKINVKNTN